MAKVRVTKEFRKVNSKLNIADEVFQVSKIDSVVHGVRHEVYMSLFKDSKDSKSYKTIILDPELFLVNARQVITELKKRGYKANF